MEEKDIERLQLSYVFLDECWIWIRSKVTGGYGGFQIQGQNRRAHRVSYELAYDMKPTPDQFLHHTCRNKDCVNPEHLEIVSQLTHTDSAIYGNNWNSHGKRRECYRCKLHRQQRQYLRKTQQVAERLKALAVKYAGTPEQSA